MPSHSAGRTTTHLMSPDNQTQKRRRLNNNGLETPALSRLPIPQSIQSAIRSADHTYEGQAIPYAPYSSTRDGAFSSPSPGPPARFDDASIEESAAAANEVALLQCCFGMLSRISVRHSLSSNSRNIPVVFQYPNILISTDASNSLTFEITSNEESAILAELESAAEITTQLYCYPEHGRRTARLSEAWFLNVIIYGVMAIEEAVGDFLSRRRMYLQDPLGCDRNVLYRNPHITYHGMEDIVMTELLESAPGTLEIERLEVGPDLLAQLMEDEDPLQETEAPTGVETHLFSHQKQALTFLLRRECGWAMFESEQDIWTKEKDAYGRIRYINNVSGNYQDEPPPNFQGGLLADDMGLGKTLSMICLIAANQAPKGLPSPPITPQPLEGLLYGPIETTLLIVPPPLIQAWEKQFRLHLRPGVFRCYVYHGQNRQDVESLGNFDIVITTYHTVSNIWRQNQRDATNDSGTIFSLQWYRVVLDEAHIIQNRQSHLAQSCCALRSDRRWAITGTPIQNKLTDFLSIVKFLGVYPYSEDGVFEDEISKPWRKGDPQGFLRLKTLVRNITISRTKAVVCLPARVDEIHHLDFSIEERQKYDSAKLQTVALLEAAISSGSERRMTYNALERLNFLRLICSHGLLTQARQTAARRNRIPEVTWTETIVEKSLIEGSWDSAASCSNCGIDLLESLLMGSQFPDNGPQAKNSPRTVCDGCYAHISTIGASQILCNQYVQYQNFAAATMNPDPDAPRTDQFEKNSIDSMSTKVKAMVADLLKNCTSEKSVVFSFWTYTLDLVQLMLDDRGIAHTRIDGKTPLPKRVCAMEAFQKDDSLRAILVSITCGGAGLDLTAASRVYLLEPHWNPMMEEQALCRVHRVGQRRDVTTIRYVMRDSFEEQVVQIQKRKKLLAKVTFCQGPLSEAGIGLGTLEDLKAVLE